MDVVQQVSAIVSGASIGCIVGNIAAAIMMRRAGKKWDLQLSQLRSGTSQPPNQSGYHVRLRSLPKSQRSEPVIGFRAFRVDRSEFGGYDLCPLHFVARGLSDGDQSPYNWKPVLTIASCDQVNHLLSGEESPVVTCTCGLHACCSTGEAMVWAMGSFARSAAATSQSTGLGLISGAPLLIGAVMGWGRVIQHGYKGWRSQYARPIALYGTHLMGFVRRSTAGYVDVEACWAADTSGNEVIDSLAEKYSVPVLDSLEGLERYAMEFGSPLPISTEEK